MGGRLSHEIQITHEKPPLLQHADQNVPAPLYVPRLDEFRCTDQRPCKCFSYTYDEEHRGWLRNECEWMSTGDFSVFIDPPNPDRRMQIIIRETDDATDDTTSNPKHDEFLIRVYEKTYERVLPRFIPEEVVAMIVTMHGVKLPCHVCKTDRDVVKNVDNCQHEFCLTCMEKWPQCPYCRVGRFEPLYLRQFSTVPPPRNMETRRHPHPDDGIPVTILSSNPTRNTSPEELLRLADSSPWMHDLGILFIDIMQISRDGIIKAQIIDVNNKLRRRIHLLTSDEYQDFYYRLYNIIQQYRQGGQGWHRQDLINAFRIWLTELNSTINRHRRREPV